MTTTPKYWFRAKRYGWGWGWPMSWQGWLVMVLWFLILTFETFFSVRDSREHVVFAIGMVSVLIGICYVKGEPLRWRWGSDDRR